MIGNANRFVGWSVVSTDNPDSCFGTFEREQSAIDCAKSLSGYGNNVRIEEAYVPDVFANQEAELKLLRVVAEAARSVRDWSVRSYGKSETELGAPLFALRAALAALDGES